MEFLLPQAYIVYQMVDGGYLPCLITNDFELADARAKEVAGMAIRAPIVAWYVPDNAVSERT